MSPADNVLAVEEALNLNKFLGFMTPQPLKACGAQSGRAAETRVTREGPWATSTQQTFMSLEFFSHLSGMRAPIYRGQARNGKEVRPRRQEQ